MNKLVVIYTLLTSFLEAYQRRKVKRTRLTECRCCLWETPLAGESSRFLGHETVLQRHVCACMHLTIARRQRSLGLNGRKAPMSASAAHLEAVTVLCTVISRVYGLCVDF